MIDLYTSPTPNGWKASIMLEEVGLPYTVKPIDLGKLEQKEDWYTALNPNGRIPTIVDRDADDFAVFESGAILVYLAEKTGRLLPSDLRRRVAALEWLNWQMGNQGPMAGQAGHFRNYAPEKIEYGIERYTNEARRLYGVLDKRLEGREFIADEYSVADIASWPWIALHGHHGVDPAAFPNVERWFGSIGEREAVKRGTSVGLEAIQAGEQGTLIDRSRRQLPFEPRVAVG